MAVSTVLKFSGVTQEKYDRMSAELGKMRDGPEGILIHVCEPTEDGWRIADVWESCGSQGSPLTSSPTSG